MTDAPKIDTQAARIGTTTGIDFGTSKDTTILTLMIDGKPHHASADGPWGQAILALLAERDLSAAREAAAAMAMRDECADMVEREGHGLHVAIRHAPLPDTTALDRLIAERVREAYFAGHSTARNWHDDVLSVEDGFANFIAARGSREGQS